MQSNLWMMLAPRMPLSLGRKLELVLGRSILFALVIAMTGCSYTRASFRPVGAMKPLRSKTAADVAIFEAIPDRPARVLGLVETSTTVFFAKAGREKILGELQQKAAEIGADAILVHLHCPPHAIALSWQGASHVLQSSELPVTLKACPIKAKQDAL